MHYNNISVSPPLKGVEGCFTFVICCLFLLVCMIASKVLMLTCNENIAPIAYFCPCITMQVYLVLCLHDWYWRRSSWKTWLLVCSRSQPLHITPWVACCVAPSWQMDSCSNRSLSPLAWSWLYLSPDLTLCHRSVKGFILRGRSFSMGRGR